ncbi:MAG: DUF1801 domain-containing protein [Ardenticatenales bacterium]|jgi:hypothetical protein|nr:DUF1801 domain-containing protein [Ardenticatenales bacterium]
MAELKTRRTDASVADFLAAIPDEGRRADCLAVADLMAGVTGAEAEMWGPAIVGFGRYHYRYASGREGDWFLAGFSPRKQNLTLYLMSGYDDYEALLARLGKHTIGKSCLYIKRLSDIDVDVLRELVTASVAHMRATNP